MNKVVIQNRFYQRILKPNLKFTSQVLLVFESILGWVACTKSTGHHCGLRRLHVPRAWATTVDSN